jgi:hypothetical protein
MKLVDLRQILDVNVTSLTPKLSDFLRRKCVQTLMRKRLVEIE